MLAYMQAYGRQSQSRSFDIKILRSKLLINENNEIFLYKNKDGKIKMYTESSKQIVLS